MTEGQAEVQQEAKGEARVEEQPWPELAYHLYSNQFQQMAWLAMAAAGGVLVMLQVGYFKSRPVPAMIATILFAVTALISTIGHFELIRGVTERKSMRKTLKGLVVFTMFLFGCGTGLVIMRLVRTSFRAG